MCHHSEEKHSLQLHQNQIFWFLGHCLMCTVAQNLYAPIQTLEFGAVLCWDLCEISYVLIRMTEL